MSITVTCPICKEKNIGSAFRCIKCDTNLVGIPREGDTFSTKSVVPPEKQPSDENKPSILEGRLHAVWRTFQSSLLIFFLATLVTAFICWSLNKRTMYEFGDSLFLQVSRSPSWVGIFSMATRNLLAVRKIL